MYKTVRDGLIAILNAQGLSESNEPTDFKNAGSEEQEHTFILNRRSGQENQANERQPSFLYDDQKWTIQIAFGKSMNSGNVQLDNLNSLVDSLIIALDNPDNWNSFCQILRYKNWKIDEVKSYFVATIELSILDRLTYT